MSYMRVLCSLSHNSFCSIPIAMLCAFLLGFGDSCFNTQVCIGNNFKSDQMSLVDLEITVHLVLVIFQLMSLLGNFYSDNSASAFAIFKFTQVRIISTLSNPCDTHFLILAVPKYFADKFKVMVYANHKK